MSLKLINLNICFEFVFFVYLLVCIIIITTEGGKQNQYEKI